MGTLEPRKTVWKIPKKSIDRMRVTLYFSSNEWAFHNLTIPQVRELMHNENIPEDAAFKISEWVGFRYSFKISFRWFDYHDKS